VADEIKTLIDRLQPTFPILLGNMVSLEQVAITYQPSIEQLLVLLPPAVEKLRRAPNWRTGTPSRPTKGCTCRSI
jgi:ABC-type transporter Mla subunit MlaD